MSNTSTRPARSPGLHRASRPPRRPSGRPGRTPRPAAATVALVVAGLGFGATVGLGLTATTAASLRAPGGVLMLVGNLTGLAGSYLALVMVLLVSRIPVVERVVGQDGLLRLHRRLSPWPISLIVVHAVALTLAYAQAAKTGPLRQLDSFLHGYPGMVTATIGFGLLVGASALSVHSVRRRLRRETWWAIHLGMYLAFALAFAHEVDLGPSFVGHPLTQLVWTVAWAATAGAVLAYRIGLPLVRSLRHGLRVAEVRHEADGVVSILLTGRHLDRLRVAGGQFFEWRFLTRHLWWQAHPYSLSARPRPPYLRITVKAVGDHSAALAHLAPGTRVALEGPYGAFTTHARRRRTSAFVAGGVGITAVRALLEDLPRAAAPVVVWRVSSASELPLAHEVRELVAELRGTLHVLAGSRHEVTPDAALDLVPDLHRRDLFVAGSDGFVRAVAGRCLARGIDPALVHTEVFSL